jgi:3-hydroxyisobutyrate dehydrogenase-like beta-hydroxyacid dehydrogenase
MRMALALTEALSISLPHLEDAVKRYEMLAAQGDGELNHSALHKLL